MSEVEKLKRVCKQLEKKKDEQARLVGRKEQIEQQLRDRFNCDSIEEARELAEELEEELEKERERANESLEELNNIVSEWDV